MQSDLEKAFVLHIIKTWLNICFLSFVMITIIIIIIIAGNDKSNWIWNLL